MGLVFTLGAANLAMAANMTLHGQQMSLTVQSKDGSYEILEENLKDPVIRTGIAAEIDHKWVRSSDYPHHEISQSVFTDVLGKGRQITIRSTGLSGLPDLFYTIKMYDTEPFGTIKVLVQNHTSHTITVQNICSVEAIGRRAIRLGNSESSDRVLSDSFSEDWPPLKILDVNQVKGVIYNRQSKESLFFGALTSDKFLTVMHLGEEDDAQNGLSIASYQVDSTGTTGIQASDPGSGLREGPQKNLIELSLPVPSGGEISSECLMFAAGNNYYSQLDHYGAAIRILHHSRVSADNLLGWWSWTAFYSSITEGNTWTNAQWLAEYLKKFGYDYFHLDLGYGFTRGEYATPNASRFPRGMSPLAHKVCRLGLKMGFWTAPFEVSDRSSVYEDHKDWLVHNDQGEPIQIGQDEIEDGKEMLFVLDSTNPAAQQYLRETYRTLVRDWGATYIKLDFMDKTAIEGHYYRPNTTALEAQRIGLQVIRQTVGEEVLLDKDGSPMLNPVGIVDDGRISQDTGHSFQRSKEADPGIAARYYMNVNFFRDDPDAFTVSRQLILDAPIDTPLTLSEAQVSIALSAVSGGMFEIGDDLPTLGKDSDRVDLVKNPDLLQMAKMGHAALPLDLLTYRSQDEQPSIFLLHEDARQSILAVFNWTDQSRSHILRLTDPALLTSDRHLLIDVFSPKKHVYLDGNVLRIESQPPHSVRLIKFIDESVPAAAPSISFDPPKRGEIGQNLQFAAISAKTGVPATAYHWDFGDGVSSDKAAVVHTYTHAGKYGGHLIVDGIDRVPYENFFTVSISGAAPIPAPQRFEGKNP
jgi:hypothetical protein